MSDKPILFQPAMVRALLDGRKTMRRRVLKAQPPADFKFLGYYAPRITAVFEDTSFAVRDDLAITLPYAPKDRLWVRETMRWDAEGDNYYFVDKGVGNERYRRLRDEWGCRSVPSIFMPRWASRITLAVTAVKVERVQSISEADARAEGLEHRLDWLPQWRGAPDLPWRSEFPRDAFRNLWDSINAAPKPVYETIEGRRQIVSYVSYPWEDVRETREHRGRPWQVIGNPWVGAYTFTVRKGNIDA